MRRLVCGYLGLTFRLSGKVAVVRLDEPLEECNGPKEHWHIGRIVDLEIRDLHADGGDLFPKSLGVARRLVENPFTLGQEIVVEAVLLDLLRGGGGERVLGFGRVG